MYPLFGVKFVFLVVLSTVSTLNSTALYNLNVITEINLRNNLISAKYKITLLNLSQNGLSRYKFTLKDEIVYIAFANSMGKELNYEGNSSEDGKIKNYSIILDRNVEINQQYQLTVILFYPKSRLEQLGKSSRRKAEEDQTFRFKTALGFYSPYETKSSKVRILLLKNSLISAVPSPNNKFRFSDEVTYEIGKLDSDRDNYKEIEILFRHNNPFLVITSLDRIIDVSHFGRISIEDNVAIKNEGPARLFSSLETAGIKDWLYTHLPASSEDIKLFDILGNNSRSSVINSKTYTTLKFAPRYPLLGGWKTVYTVQYTVPTHEYLFEESQSQIYYLKNMRLVDHVISDSMIETASIRIFLPEGAEILQIEFTPTENFEIKSSEKYCKSNLCVFGNQAILIQGRNIIENHENLISITYSFKKLYLFRVPLVCSLYLQFIFVMVLVYKYFFIQKL